MHCEYQTLEGSYSCIAQTIDNVISQIEEIAIDGTHVQGLGNTDVNYIAFHSSVINYIPNKMYIIFLSISLFQIIDSALHTLTTDAFTNCFYN